jgi:hypothetical protein
MTFNHGAKARFYWHTRDMSPYVEGVDMGLTRGLAEHRPLSGEAVTRIAGFEDGSITLSGAAWEAATSDLTAYTRFHESSSRPFAFCPAGDAVGSVAYCGVSNAGSMGVVAGDDVVRLPVSLVTAARYDRCKVLHALGSTVTSPGSGVNNGGATTGGGMAYLIVTAITGTTPELTVTVEDSADGSTYATLLAMTAISAVGSEAKAKTGTIRQYLRVTWTLTGTDTPTATWFLAFGRR